MEAVRVEKVSFSYGSLQVLRELSLEVPSGISFGLLGPNGAGKTTLIYLLIGLLKPKSGTLQVLGSVPSQRNAPYIGYMPQSTALYQELTVYDNLDFFARVYGIRDRRERRQRIEEMLEMVELPGRASSQVFKLSGGMKQRISLACALIHRPDLLLLDEPTAGIDPELRVAFWDHFKELSRNGVTLIISSHTMDDAARCDQLVFLRDGRAIAQGSPDELRRATGQPGCTLEDAFLHFARMKGEADVS